MVVGQQRDVTIGQNAGAGGVAQHGLGVGIDAVGGAGTGAAERGRNTTAGGRHRAGQHEGPDGLAVGGGDRQVQVLCGVVLGADLRALHHGKDLVGRRRKQLLPLVFVGKVLAENQIVERAVFVGVLGHQLVLADVLIDLARTRTRSGAEFDDVVFDQLVRLVGALHVFDGPAVGVGVVTHEIACDRHTDGRAHTRAATGPDTDGGRDDGGLDAAARIGLDSDIATSDQRGVGQPGIDIAQDDVERRSTRAAHANARPPAHAGSHGSGQREDLDAGLGSGQNLRLIEHVDRGPGHLGPGDAINHIACQRHANGNADTGRAAHRHGDRGRAGKGVDAGVVGGSHREGARLHGIEPLASGLLGDRACMDAGTDLVFGPHARAARRDAGRAPSAHRCRTRDHQRVDVLPGLRVDDHVTCTGIE